MFLRVAPRAPNLSRASNHMSKLRVSIVEFLNTAPLVWGFTDGPLVGRYDLSFTVPSLCADALRSGQAESPLSPPSNISAWTAW